MTLKSQLDLLSKLQKHEFSAQRLRNELADVPRKLESFETQKEALRENLENEKHHLEGLKKQYRELELKVQERESQVIKSKEKLTLVKTNKEYQSSLKEIEDLESKIGEYEDLMLSLLDETEEAESELQKIAAQFEKQCDELDQAAQQVQHQKDNLETELAAHIEAQNALRAETPASLIAKFEHVQRLGVKTAIAPVIDAVCKGCQMKVPPQLFIELQRFDELKYCPHCQCIIYWEQGQEKET